MAIIQNDVVHHLYQRESALDLIPYCGALPGRDELTGDWNTGHDRDELLQCPGSGLPLRTARASLEALGGFTPVILSDQE